MITALLTEFQFTYYKKCACDGFVTEVWRKGDTELRWRKHRGTFKIREGKITTKGWDAVSNLEKHLNEFYKTVPA